MAVARARSWPVGEPQTALVAPTAQLRPLEPALQHHSHPPTAPQNTNQLQRTGYCKQELAQCPLRRQEHARCAVGATSPSGTHPTHPIHPTPTTARPSSIWHTLRLTRCLSRVSTALACSSASTQHLDAAGSTTHPHPHPHPSPLQHTPTPTPHPPTHSSTHPIRAPNPTPPSPHPPPRACRCEAPEADGDGPSWAQAP